MSEGAALGGETAAPSAGELLERLRPRTATEILDGAFRLYRGAFARVVPRLLLLGLPAIAAALESPILGQVVVWLFLTPTWFALCLRDGMDQLEGRTRGVWPAFGGVLRAWLPLLVLYVLYTFALMIAAMVGFLPGLLLVVGAGAADVEWLATAFAVLAGATGIAALALPWAYLGLYGPVYLFERRGNPFARSIELVRGGFWKVVGVLLLTTLITMLPIGVLQVAIALEDGPAPVNFAAELAGRSWHVIASIAVTALVTPFAHFALLLLWIDRRAVREGVDLLPPEHARSAS